MIQMPSLEYNEILRLLNSLPNDKEVQSEIAEVIKEEVDEFVPYDTGYLAASAKVSDGRLIYTAPYASIVHGGYSYGKPMTFSLLKHPKATSNWIDVGVDQKGKRIYPRIVEIVSKRFERG